MTGIELITKKREKHASKGWTAKHDQTHIHGELAMVACILAVKHTDAWADLDLSQDENQYLNESNVWGLENNPDVIDRLAVAGSLIAAEIDRLQSLASKNEKQS